MDIENIFVPEKIQPLLDSFCDSVGIASAIIDLEGAVFIKSNWQKLCTDFYRHPVGWVEERNPTLLPLMLGFIAFNRNLHYQIKIVNLK